MTIDIVKRLRHTEEETATIGQELVYLQVPVNPDGPEAADEIELLRKQLAHSVDLGNSWLNEIERLRRDVTEANARAYVMAQELTLWQSRSTSKEPQA
jgi:hypothetical protein